jgi:hypothetical protein
MPDPMPLDQVDRLLKIGSKHGFRLEEVQYGTLRTRMWWTTNQKMRADWPMVIINSMHSGWGLKGFGDWKARGMDRRYIRKLGLVNPPDEVRQDRNGNFIINETLRMVVIRSLEKSNGKLEKPGV